MAENSNTPEIRFKGFTDPWEQRKLGDISDSYSGGTPQANNPAYYEGSIPFIRSAEINAEKTELFLTEKGLNESSAAMVDVGCVLYALYGATSGEVGISRIKGAINQAILAIEPHKGFDSRYIAFWLRAQKAAITETYLQGGQGNLSGAIIKNIDLSAPGFPEQQRIGEYFDELTFLITLTSRKHEKLVQMKKAMLNKMFPAPGEQFPEIRFKGFTDPWEQRKLGDEFAFLKNNTLSRAELSDAEGVVRNIHYGDILIKFGSVLDAADPGIPRIVNEETALSLMDDQLRNGDVVVADTAEDETAGKCTELRGIGDGKIVAGLHTMPLRPSANYAPGFLGHYLNSDAYHDQLKPLMQGIKVISISRAALAETRMTIPCFDEQRLIGEYFCNLDHLITLTSRKVELLRNIKKAMLNKMFV